MANGLFISVSYGRQFDDSLDSLPGKWPALQKKKEKKRILFNCRSFIRLYNPNWPIVSAEWPPNTVNNPNTSVYCIFLLYIQTIKQWAMPYRARPQYASYVVCAIWNMTKVRQSPISHVYMVFIHNIEQLNISSYGSSLFYSLLRMSRCLFTVGWCCVHLFTKCRIFSSQNWFTIYSDFCLFVCYQFTIVLVLNGYRLAGSLYGNTYVIKKHIYEWDFFVAIIDGNGEIFNEASDTLKLRIIILN